MQNWEYTFPSSSKEEWLQQISRDLKGKPLDSLTGEWWPGESMIPLHHSSDLDSESIELPAELFANPPRIVETLSVDGNRVESINAWMLEALQFGTQDFHIYCNDATPLDIEKWLQGIHVEMINLILVDSPGAFPLFNTIYDQSPQNCFLRYQRTKS